MENLYPWPKPPSWLDSLLPKRLYEVDDTHAIEFFGPKGHSPQQVREWILSVCSELRISPSYLAKLSGVAASTINRFLRQPVEDTANLTATTIEKLREVAGNEVIARFAGPVAINNALKHDYEKYIRVVDLQHDAHVKAEMLKNHVIPSGPYCYFPKHYFDREAYFHGKISNEIYFNEADWADLFGFEVTVPMIARDNACLIAMPLSTHAGEPTYKCNSIAIGRMLCTFDCPLADNSDVIAFRRRPEDNKINCGVWRFARDPKGRFWLLPIGDGLGDEGVYLGHSPLDHIEAVYISHEIIGNINELAA